MQDSFGYNNDDETQIVKLDISLMNGIKWHSWIRVIKKKGSAASVENRKHQKNLVLHKIFFPYSYNEKEKFKP